MKHKNNNEKQQASSSIDNKVVKKNLTKTAVKKKRAVSKKSTNKTIKTKIKSGSEKKSRSSGDKQARWDDKLSPDERALYETRTRRLAESDEGNGDNSDQVTFIKFRLGKSEWYGMPYEHIEEILYANGIASVPTTPKFIAGVINRTGEMLTILDLRTFFSSEWIEHGDDARIMVVKGNGLTVGFLVDEIAGNDYYVLSLLAEPLPSEGVSNIRYVKGLHQGCVTIIDPEALLSDQAIRVG